MKYVERLIACQPELRVWVDRLTDSILPWRCVVCGLDGRAPGICAACLRGLPWNRSSCAGCGLPLSSSDESRCGACLSRTPVFDGVFSPLLFGFPVNRLMHRFKFSRDLAIGRVLGWLLLQQLKSSGCRVLPGQPDMIIPVPMHRLRLVSRGLNPAYELGRQFAGSLGVPLVAHRLQRRRHTPEQSGLDARSRRRNLRAAFSWRGGNLKGMRVVLVDDVMTTGSTISECTHVLKRAGAEKVHAWTVARAARA